MLSTHLPPAPVRRLAITLNIIAVVYALALIAGLFSGCGPSTRERTIKTTLATVNAARDAFVVFDEKAQLAIANNAPVTEVSALLVTYRQKREAVVEAFTIVYRAIAIAATANDDPSIAAMFLAARQVADEYAKFQKRHAP